MKLLKCLGHVYRWRLGGYRSTNLESSTEYYRKASRMAIYEKLEGEEVFEIASGLSKAWAQRVKGNHGLNDEKAIETLFTCEACVENLESLDADKKDNLLKQICGEQAMLNLEQGLGLGGIGCRGMKYIQAALRLARLNFTMTELRDCVVWRRPRCMRY